MFHTTQLRIKKNIMGAGQDLGSHSSDVRCTCRSASFVLTSGNPPPLSTTHLNMTSVSVGGTDRRIRINEAFSSISIHIVSSENTQVFLLTFSKIHNCGAHFFGWRMRASALLCLMRTTVYYTGSRPSRLVLSSVGSHFYLFFFCVLTNWF